MKIYFSLIIFVVIFKIIIIKHTNYLVQRRKKRGGILMKAREREGNRGKIFSLRIMYDIWEGRAHERKRNSWSSEKGWLAGPNCLPGSST